MRDESGRSNAGDEGLYDTSDDEKGVIPMAPIRKKSNKRLRPKTWVVDDKNGDTKRAKDGGCSRKKQMIMLPRAGPMKYVVKGLPVPKLKEPSQSLPGSEVKVYPTSYNYGGLISTMKAGTPECRERLNELIERSKKIKRGEYKFPPQPAYKVRFQQIMQEKRAKKRLEMEALLSKEPSLECSDASPSVGDESDGDIISPDF